MPNAGDIVRASDTTRYACKADQNSVQSIGTGSFTAIQFNGADSVDDLGVHDPVTNNSRFMLGLSLGWWMITGKFVTGASAVASQRRCRFILNGSTGVNGGYAASPLMTAASMTGGFWTLESTTMVQVTASTDYVEMQGYQDTGGSINTTVSGDLRSEFLAVFLHS